MTEKPRWFPRWLWFILFEEKPEDKPLSPRTNAYKARDSVGLPNPRSAPPMPPVPPVRNTDPFPYQTRRAEPPRVDDVPVTSLTQLVMLQQVVGFAEQEPSVTPMPTLAPEPQGCVVSRTEGSHAAPAPVECVPSPAPSPYVSEPAPSYSYEAPSPAPEPSPSPSSSYD
jgi:hypothetical protein